MAKTQARIAFTGDEYVTLCAMAWAACKLPMPFKLLIL